MKVSLKYGRSAIEVEVPDKNLNAVLLPNEGEKVFDESDEIKRALSNPIGSKRLSEIVKDRENAVVVVSDITRPVPSSLLLPPLIDELVTGGLDEKAITILFALGSHRKQSDEEKRKLIGDEIFKRLKSIDHDVNDCIHIGRTSRGTDLEIFRPVVEADLKVLTGAIDVHYFAGYTGGLKSILPGVSSMKTIEANHQMLLMEDARAGNIDGPIRKDIEEAGAILGVDFILNVVLNSRKEIVKAVAGDPIKAHREGVKIVDQMYKVPLQPSEIVLASAGGFPKDLNLYQAHKALENASNAVKSGGTLILLAECLEGFANAEFERWIREADIPRDLLERLACDFKIGGHKAACIARFLERGEVVLVSAMDEKDVRRAFMIPAKSVEEALDYAFSKHGKDASITVIPYAGSTLPIVIGDMK
ncbi:MAG: nickel-dependent lactate racemase [Candidatus Syntrophoarchaeum sp.]|nr:nickel-dependent lactate racemase [Candidatus Syntrophoarchaeum sp.]